MDENYQSEWTKSIPLKEQKKIIKRLMKFAKPFRRTFIVAILFAFALSVINVLLPRIIQTFMDDHLAKQSATTQVILFFAGVYFVWSHSQKYHLVFPMVFVFHGFIEDLSVCSGKII